MSKPAKPAAQANAQGVQKKPRIDPFKYVGTPDWGKGGEYFVRAGQRGEAGKEIPVPPQEPAPAPDQPEKKDAK